MDTLTWIATWWPVLVLLPPAVIGLAAVLAAFTPNKRDDEIVGQAAAIWQKVRPFLDGLAMNIKNAKNAAPPPKAQK